MEENIETQDNKQDQQDQQNNQQPQQQQQPNLAEILQQNQSALNNISNSHLELTQSSQLQQLLPSQFKCEPAEAVNLQQIYNDHQYSQLQLQSSLLNNEMNANNNNTNNQDNNHQLNQQQLQQSLFQLQQSQPNLIQMPEFQSLIPLNNSANFFPNPQDLKQSLTQIDNNKRQDNTNSDLENNTTEQLQDQIQQDNNNTNKNTNQQQQKLIENLRKSQSMLPLNLVNFSNLNNSIGNSMNFPFNNPQQSNISNNNDKISTINNAGLSQSMNGFNIGNSIQDLMQFQKDNLELRNSVFNNDIEPQQQQNNNVNNNNNQQKYQQEVQKEEQKYLKERQALKNEEFILKLQKQIQEQKQQSLIQSHPKLNSLLGNNNNLENNNNEQQQQQQNLCNSKIEEDFKYNNANLNDDDLNNINGYKPIDQSYNFLFPNALAGSILNNNNPNNQNSTLFNLPQSTNLDSTNPNQNQLSKSNDTMFKIGNLINSVMRKSQQSKSKNDTPPNNNNNNNINNSKNINNSINTSIMNNLDFSSKLEDLPNINTHINNISQLTQLQSDQKQSSNGKFLLNTTSNNNIPQIKLEQPAINTNQQSDINKKRPRSLSFENSEEEEIKIKEMQQKLRILNQKQKDSDREVGKVRMQRVWNEDEDYLLKYFHKKFNGKWELIANMIPGRNASQSLQRFRKFNNQKSSRSHWSHDEDQQVQEMIKKYGKNWGLIASSLNGRTGKQVRERFINCLDPSINWDPFTEQEDKTIIDFVNNNGAKWSLISKLLQGRPENMLKNRYYAHLKRKQEAAQNPNGTGRKTKKQKNQSQQQLQKEEYNNTQDFQADQL